MKQLFNFSKIFLISFIVVSCGGSTVVSNKSAEDTTTMVVSDTIKEQTEPWMADQLLDPAELAKTLGDKSATQPYIFSIGPSGDILGSTDIGPLTDTLNLNTFKSALESLDRNTEIVIYCGCCPFENCPNIRPGFELLNNMNFTNHKLLNLPKNLKVDWIDKGYPMQE